MRWAASPCVIENKSVRLKAFNEYKESRFESISRLQLVSRLYRVPQKNCLALVDFSNDNLAFINDLSISKFS